MRVERPIFVVGIGRSGSTLFHDLLAAHPDLAWLSNLCARFPDAPRWNRRLLRAIDLPLVGPPLRRRIRPAEPYRFWDRGFPGFSEPCRDLRADDVTETARARLHAALGATLTGRRSRLLAKVTGWPRTGFLREVFPDARFIHVLRDGRAVAASFLGVPWWRGWRGPTVWRWGPLSAADAAEWERHDRSFAALAAIQWKIFMRAMERAREALPDGSLLEVKYEDLCDAPWEAVRDAAAWCGLPADGRFEVAVRSRRIRDARGKWRDTLTPAQQAAVEAVLAGALARHGYA